MNGWVLLLPVLVPALSALLVLLIPKKGWFKQIPALICVCINLLTAILLFGRQLSCTLPWCGSWINFTLSVYQFSSVIFLAVSAFAFLTVIYSTVFMRGKQYEKQFLSCLLATTALVNGAVFAASLVVLLFFWEGLLATLFLMILTGSKKAFPTAVKALVLSGTADLCMMLGIGLTIYLSNGISEIGKINLSLDFPGALAFLLLMTGATAKAGAMPFHSWIPDAAADTPLPFMAFLPASLEKLLGIYLLARISLDMFKLESGTPVSIVLMVTGAVTIIFAVMMALIQKDYKRLLSYHAISQVGYMILGIGTAVPIGIVGGLFHMLNHAMYKSCLFFTAGSVEYRTGTTDLTKLGGLSKRMPVTTACFLIAAASITGVPPFNGFFSKELVFEGAIETGMPIFYIIAALGAFFTAASFLKLGHTVYFGKSSNNNQKVREAPWQLLVPMLILAAGCVLFGVYNPLPLKGLIEPVLGTRLEHTVSGFPSDLILSLISVLVLVLAVMNHIYGTRRAKSALGAADHIHHAPGLSAVYRWAELRYLDPYDIGLKVVKSAARLFLYFDRGIDWLVSSFPSLAISSCSAVFRRAKVGNPLANLVLSLAGILFIAVMIALF